MADDLDIARHSGADPERIATAQDFGRELTLVRTTAGLTIRQVARTAGLPVSTLGDYFSGRHLPGLAQSEQVLNILRACGESDPLSLAKWTEALGRARRSPGRRTLGDSPYRGLARFEREHAPWFFGREEVSDRLLQLSLEDSTAHEGQDVLLPLVLVGPSGSGKSSLLRAGLLPRLEGPGMIVEPDGMALPELLSRIIGHSELATPLTSAVIVDQFEALFTDYADEAERMGFITELCALASSRLVVLALRADFYERALRYPVLARALQSRQVVLGPMNAEQVRRAITEPARMARLDVEDGLVELLLGDLAPPTHGFAGDGVSRPREADQSAYEPGALPLLSHAMLATWENSRGGVLAIADYVASGGIRDALTRTAEAAYGSLPKDEQRLAQRLFLRLVHVADNAPPTRATVDITELRIWAGSDAERVLARFVAERLITLDADSARITHDALLAAWPRLRSWVDEGMDDLRTARRITEGARAWQEADYEPAALWRGNQLATAEEWAADPDKKAALASSAAEFVRASIAAEQDRQRATRRRTRLLQRLVASLTALTVAVLGLAAYSFQQRQAASTARDNAESRQISVEADQIRSQDVMSAAQLSISAYSIARTPQAAASLLESAGSPQAARLLDSSGVVESVSLQPDHKLLAVATGDGTLRLWDVVAPGHPVPVGGLLENDAKDPFYTTAFSPDGQVLAAAGAAHAIFLWRVAPSGRAIRIGTPLTGPANTVYSLAFSPNGTLLAAGSADNTVRLWDIANPARPEPVGGPLTGASGYVESVAFSPSGTTLAAGSADKTVRLWNVADPTHPVALGAPLSGPGSIVTSVGFSPNGALVAAGSQDNKVWLWKMGQRGGVPDGTLSNATDWVNAVAFSPDGSTLAAGTSDSSILTWSVATRSLTATLPEPQPVTSVAWDGLDRLVAGDANGTVATWHLPPPILLTGSPAYDAAFSPDGAALAVTSQGGLQLWSTAQRKLLAVHATPGTFPNAVQFAPRGRILAATYGNGLIQIFHATDSLVPLSSTVVASASGQAETTAFSPDGRILATGGDDGTVRLWSVSDPAHPQLLATERDSGTYVFGVAFAPDGKTLAAASADNLTRLWNVSDPARPRLAARPLSGLSSYAISVAFSPNGRLLAVGSADKTVRLWDVTNLRRPVLAAAPLIGPAGYVYGVAFSRDGKTLAEAVTDDSVWLWNLSAVAHPTVVATLTGPTGHVYSVAFNPTADAVAAASADGTVRLWAATPSAAFKAICADIGQPLTKGEWTTYVPGVPYHVPCH